MEQILYIFIGAILALAGGILTQLRQKHLSQIKEDENLLFQAQCFLLDYYALIKQKRRQISENSNTLKSSVEEYKLCRELSNIAIRIKTKRNQKLAVMLTKFALDDIYRTDENLCSLTREVQMVINEPMIKRYENDMKDLLELLKRKLSEPK